MARRIVLTLASALVCAVPVLHADTHRFVPTHFYNTYSFAHPPALRIKPGDRVVTSTLDASGVDKDGKQQAAGPNPQTGPFYVEGAEPGDLLVVRIEKIETNRATAYSSSLLAPYAVDPASIGARVDREPKRVTWQLDSDLFPRLSKRRLGQSLVRVVPPTSRKRDVARPEIARVLGPLDQQDLGAARSVPQDQRDGSSSPVPGRRLEPRGIEKPSPEPFAYGIDRRHKRRIVPRRLEPALDPDSRRNRTRRAAVAARVSPSKGLL